MQLGEVLFRQRLRVSAPAGVAPEPPGDSGRIVWAVFLAGVCACFLVETESSTKVSVRTVGSGELESWILASVRAVGSGEPGSWILASVLPAQLRQLVS